MSGNVFEFIYGGYDDTYGSTPAPKGYVTETWRTGTTGEYYYIGGAYNHVSGECYVFFGGEKGPIGNMEKGFRLCRTK